MNDASPDDFVAKSQGNSREADTAAASQAYAAALLAYLQQGSEDLLMEAYTLARAALSADQPVADIVLAHNAALAGLDAEAARDALIKERSMVFALEYLSVYDMALLGYKLTLPKLTEEISERRRIEQQLRAATTELAIERDSLDAKVAQRTHELAEQADNLQTTLEHLRQTNREQAEFTYAISHDLKSPSNTLLMLLGEMRAGHGASLDPDALELIDLAEQTATRMRTLVDDVLAYAACVETQPAHAPVDLNALVQTLLQDLRYDIQHQQARIDCENLPMVIGNPMQLKLLLQNLVSNAIKFRDRDRPPVVRIASQALKGNRSLIKVQDNGIGIDPAHFDRIFGLFQRLHAHDHYGGSGIGLALCKRIALNHGGEISLSSVAGQGTTFTVSLERLWP
jgi:signal transduction histidine kinase